MTIGSEIKAAEQAVVNEVKKAGHDLAVLFGPKADAFKSAAEELLKSEAGKIVATGVQAAKAALPNGIGPALHAVALAFSSEALKHAGLEVGTQLVNLAIETLLATV